MEVRVREWTQECPLVSGSFECLLAQMMNIGLLSQPNMLNAIDVAGICCGCGEEQLILGKNVHAASTVTDDSNLKPTTLTQS
jgi:hypothetical protein